LWLLILLFFLEKLVVLSGMDSVARVFESLVRKHGGGGRLTVYQNGQQLLDVFQGVVNEKGEPWTNQTLAYVASCTKFVTNVVVARLVDQGLLCYEEKVRKYWPAFSADVILEELLSHRAGLGFFDSMVDFPVEALSHPGEGERWVEWVAFLAGQKPVSPVGEPAYHAVTVG
jgi:CubicO group peptidase (beta-lactamase class C family)